MSLASCPAQTTYCKLLFSAISIPVYTHLALVAKRNIDLGNLFNSAMNFWAENNPIHVARPELINSICILNYSISVPKPLLRFLRGGTDLLTPLHHAHNFILSPTLILPLLSPRRTNSRYIRLWATEEIGPFKQKERNCKSEGPEKKRFVLGYVKPIL